MVALSNPWKTAYNNSISGMPTVLTNVGTYPNVILSENANHDLTCSKYDAAEVGTTVSCLNKIADNASSISSGTINSIISQAGIGPEGAVITLGLARIIHLSDGSYAGLPGPLDFPDTFTYVQITGNTSGTLNDQDFTFDSSDLAALQTQANSDRDSIIVTSNGTTTATIQPELYLLVIFTKPDGSGPAVPYVVSTVDVTLQVVIYPLGATVDDKAMIDLATAGFAQGTLSDRAVAFLRSKGYTGTLDDMLVQAGGQRFIDLYPDFKAMGLL